MKKTCNRILLIIVFAISGLTGFTSAQQININPSIDTLFEQKLAGEKIHLNTVNVIGSYFLNDEWANGDIHLTNGNWVINKQLKYNSFTDELIWLRPKDYTMILLEKEQILEFKIKIAGFEKILHFKKMDLTGTATANKFYQVLYEGRYGLYCNRRVISAESTTEKFDYSTYYVPILKRAPVYIILSQSGTLMTIEKISNKAFLKNYPHDKNVLKNLFRENHLHLKTEDDLITAVKAIEKNNLLY